LHICYHAFLPTDDELLDAWRAGDKTAGEQLFDRYFRPLKRFFANKTAEGIDDLIQSVFLGLLEASDRYRAEGSFRSYVFGIAYNVLRNHYRAQRRVADNVDFGVTSIHDLAAGPSVVLVEREQAALLLQGLRRIPVDHQVLLELYFWEPMSAPEIASVLGVPVGTVRTRIRRAKTLLEAELAKLTADVALREDTISNLEDWARAIRPEQHD
jgi:RNA polymerase sigma factor (sigma-70 family)